MCIFSNSCIFFVNQKWDNIWFLCDLCLLNDTQVFVNILKRIIVMLYYYFSVNIISLFVRGIMHPNIDRYLNIQGFGCVMSLSAFLGERIMPIQWHNLLKGLTYRCMGRVYFGYKLPFVKKDILFCSFQQRKWYRPSGCSKSYGEWPWIPVNFFSITCQAHCGIAY